MQVEFKREIAWRTCRSTDRAGSGGATSIPIRTSPTGRCRRRRSAASTEADAESLDAAHAVEVHNALSAREGRGDSWHLTDVLLNRGRRLSAYAADDAHFQPQDPPGCAAWVQVRAASLDPEALLAALKAGHYYASTGPELRGIRLRRGVLSVTCSPVRKVMVTGGVPGVRLVEGEGLTECALPVGMFGGGYCRVTVEDARGGCAWSNPIRLGAGG
ncbi:hypothetical protein [Streptomyces sp. NPDC056049]|uniref:hypothetical protein n=1 Tax=Streptomyces sp. NPDC056049 TaxID=3345693 RepID=UPI0035D553B7